MHRCKKGVYNVMGGIFVPNATSLVGKIREERWVLVPGSWTVTIPLPADRCE